MGTILPYVGDISAIPKKWHLCDGTEGTPNLLDNRFLEGSYTIRMFKNAGIPNILGDIAVEEVSSDAIYSSGAFYFKYPLWQGDDGQSGADNIETMLYGFDASRCSSIYRNDIATVQPKSYTVFYIMKIGN